MATGGRESGLATLGTVVALLGIAIAVGSLIALIHVSGLGGADPDVHLAFAAIGAFLFGVFLFGWGVGRSVGR